MEYFAFPSRVSILDPLAVSADFTYSRRSKWLGVHPQWGVGPSQGQSRRRYRPSGRATRRSGRNARRLRRPERPPYRAIYIRSWHLSEPNRSRLEAPGPNGPSQGHPGSLHRTRVMGTQPPADYLKARQIDENEACYSRDGFSVHG